VYGTGSAEKYGKLATKHPWVCGYFTVYRACSCQAPPWQGTVCMITWHDVHESGLAAAAAATTVVPWPPLSWRRGGAGYMRHLMPSSQFT